MENNSEWNRLWCGPKKWSCGLMNEYEGQNKQLNQLRFKYLCKILMSNVNFLKKDVLKSRLTTEILKQYNKDVMYMGVLEQNFESLNEGIKQMDKLSKKLLQLPTTAIRDLVILFMIDEDATDVQQLHLIADIIKNLRGSMKLKVDFLDAYM
ncbi:hypothetical protein E3N88_01405 [Mikania micrantha]|uniref:Uncharacterized protein n=1 Tax=Mikania micrantha TaxID=192012 RepID=A0A5N6Q0Z8_9ASTR|nr:hypothetical protein E3N88_01405 [Mikania micrantha]